MKSIYILTVLLLSVGQSLSGIKSNLLKGVNGGFECAVCTVLAGTIQQLAEVHNQTIIQTLDRFCFLLPKKLQNTCQLISELYGPSIIEMFADQANPDDICRGLSFCYTDEGQKSCPLYKNSAKFDEEKILYHQQRLKKHVITKYGVKLQGYDICNIPGFGLLCELFDEVYRKRIPSVDKDGDRYSVIDGLRGASWRGKDCDDTRYDVHPGRRPEFYNDLMYDSNCNGILGLNNKTGKTYEEELCSNSGQMGVVVIGDSVGAHFHVAEEWFSPPLLTKESLEPLEFAIENELDWPQLSLVTGYMDSIWNVTRGPVDSIYRRLRDRNRCNHRDYQNLAVNGDDSNEVLNFTENLFRNNKTDFPLLIFVELVGNDVCNNEVDTIAHMTTPEQMHRNLLTMFDALNSKVPANSKVLIVGMADGDYLYQFLQNRTHPFGRWRNDLKYPDVYDWWECLQVTPCKGWLTRNATLRALTTQRANQLSDVMKGVADKYKKFWPNLEISYMDCPISTVIKKYLFDHGPDSGWQLIEPVDGFHPNQLGQALSAAEVWSYMELNIPHYLGPLNENNDIIQRIFGDQGGY